jgi:uncharacterized protein
MSEQSAVREVLTWQDYGLAGRALAQQVATSGFRPDIVLGIARGGLFLAASIAYAIECKNVFTMNVEFYTGVGETKSAPELLPPFLDMSELDRLNVLIADDVADSGKTLQMVTEICSAHAAEVRSAVIYEKPRSVIKPDYAWRDTDAWIDFPWSAEEPISFAM